MKKSMRNEQFRIIKNKDTYSVTIDIKDHMKELFIKHKADGFVCCGYDWCTLLIAFMYHDEVLIMNQPTISYVYCQRMVMHYNS